MLCTTRSQVELDASVAASPAFPMIFAAGAVAGPGGLPPAAGGGRRLLSIYDLQQHSTNGATTLNLAAGTSSGVQGPDQSKERMKMVSVPRCSLGRLGARSVPARAGHGDGWGGSLGFLPNLCAAAAGCCIRAAQQHVQQAWCPGLQALV